MTPLRQRLQTRDQLLLAVGTLLLLAFFLVLLLQPSAVGRGGR